MIIHFLNIDIDKSRFTEIQSDIDNININNYLSENCSLFLSSVWCHYCFACKWDKTKGYHFRDNAITAIVKMKHEEELFKYIM